jgi:phage shock protein E
MKRRYLPLPAVCILSVLLMSGVGCNSTEPAPTACPLPPMPAPASGAPPTVVAGTVDPRCSGGDLSTAEAAELISEDGQDRADVTVIDIRTPAEYATAHIPGAVNLSTQDAAFWDEIGTLSMDGVYILYCRTGSTTRRVVQQMLAMGFGSVCHIESGINGWVRDGFRIVKGDA